MVNNKIKKDSCVITTDLITSIHRLQISIVVQYERCHDLRRWVGGHYAMYAFIHGFFFSFFFKDDPHVIENKCQVDYV